MEFLSKESFIEKVFDYQTEKEWKFKGDKPAIIDFYADWCQPCKTVAPTLESLSEEYNGKLDIYKIDVDKEQELAVTFGIRSIPSILFIPIGDRPQMSAGALPKEVFKKYIEEVLKIKI